MNKCEGGKFVHPDRECQYCGALPNGHCRRPEIPSRSDADMQAEIEWLRRALAVSWAGTRLYVDDGELQDNTLQPTIDFKRDSWQAIRDKINERAARTAERYGL